ncbi:MAG: hypothetical protein JNM63_15070, partial [Spirochaetia bacterium]|nr:hypothetical protein [Spirochaetia bacterium]
SFGYISTNGTAFFSFGSAGTNIAVSSSTTLWFYGRDILGNTSATNREVYIVEPASMETNAGLVIHNNPYRGEDEGIVFENIPAGGSLRVFTISGKNVLTLRRASDGVSKLIWNLKDENGRRVSPGVYLALISPTPAGDEKRASPFLKLMVLP